MLRHALRAIGALISIVFNIGVLCGALVWGLLLLAIPSQAATLGLHTVTWHEQHQANDAPYNGINPGAYALLDNGATLGAYRNSIRRTSVYAGYTLQTPARHFALTVGAITGYDAAPVMPLLVASARIPLGERAALRLFAVPRPTPKGSAAVSAAIEWEL